MQNIGIDQPGNTLSMIPIIIDTVKYLELYRMTRCTYYTIESSAPTTEWRLQLAETDISVVMIALSGVITSPPGDEQYFDTAATFDRLFDVLESNEKLCVEVNDFWLPNALFDNTDVQPQRGYVYRIGHDLFDAAYALREAANTDEHFLRQLSLLEVPVEIEFSESETVALSAWNLEQVAINRQHYHDNPQAKLPKKGNQPEPPPRTL